MTELDIIRSKCLNDLSFFTRYIFKERLNKKFEVSEHHEEMFKQAQAIANGEQKNTIFNIAPRYSKTEIMVKNFIAQSLAKNPKAKFIHLSYSDQLALDNSEEVKDIILSDVYQELFPYVQVKKDSKAKNKWYTTEGGGVLARSASGQVTGFGAGQVDDESNQDLFGGAIIIDDPIKPDDADSETLREKVNNKFDTTIRNRVNSRNTPIIVIMQRLHDDDLSGYLMRQDPDNWHVTSMPVIKEDGTALWESKHTLEELQELRRVNEFVFDTQYMQDPRPKEGLLFPKDELNYFTGELDKEKIEGTIGYLDIADTGDDNHSLPIGKILGNKIYVDDTLFTIEGTDVNVDLTAQMVNKHQPEYCRIESNFGGNTYVQLLQSKINEVTSLLPVKVITNKHTRITTMAGFIKEHCVFRSDVAPDSDYGRFMRNLTTYTKNGKVKHDDAPDSLEGLVKMARQFYSHLWE